MARIKDITSNGLVTLEVSEPVHTHRNYTEVTRETLAVRFLQNDDAISDYEVELLQPDVVPVTFESSEITFRLEFNQPLQVSQAAV